MNQHLYVALPDDFTHPDDFVADAERRFFPLSVTAAIWSPAMDPPPYFWLGRDADGQEGRS